MTEAQIIRRKLKRKLQTKEGRNTLKLLIDFLEFELQNATSTKKIKKGILHDLVPQSSFIKAEKTLGIAIEPTPKSDRIYSPKIQQSQQQSLIGGVVSSKSLFTAPVVAGSGMKNEPLKADSRNVEITQLLEDLRQALGVPMLDDSEARNRQYAWVMIRKFGKDDDGNQNNDIGVQKVKLIIEAIKTNDFWKYRATSFQKLWAHGVEIVNSTRDKKGGVVNVV